MRYFMRYFLSNGTIPDPLRPDFLVTMHLFGLYYVSLKERVKLRTLNLAGIYIRGPSEQKLVKTFGEKAAWAYPGTAQIFRVPLYHLKN